MSFGQKMNTKGKMIVTIVVSFGVFLFLALMIFYPFCYDHAKFAVGGEMAIKHGAIAYYDFIDTAQQFIFWIYGMSLFIFGHHEWAIRAFDILYHVVALFIFYRVLRRFLRDETVAVATVIIYCLLYVTGGIDNTALVETFAFLPSIMILYYTERGIEENNAVKYGVYSGLWAGILLFLKFTLLTVSVSAIIYLILNRPYKRRNLVRFSLGHIASLLFCALLYVLYLYANGALPKFLEAMQWLRYYSNSSYVYLGELIPAHGYHLLTPTHFLHAFGMTFTIMLSTAIFLVLYNNNSLPRIYMHLVIQLFAGLMMIYYEHRSVEYHYTRLYFAAVPLIAFCAVTNIRIIVRLFKKWKTYGIFQMLLRLSILSVVVIITLVYSPITRISKPMDLASLVVSGRNYEQEIQNHITEYYYKEIRTVSDTLRTIMKPTDEIFVWGESAGIYFYLNRLPTTICFESLPLSDPGFIQPSWRSNVLHSLQAQPPRYFIAQIPENSYTEATMFVPGLDENRPIKVWPELYDYVQMNYRERNVIGHFRIFELKK